MLKARLKDNHFLFKGARYFSTKAENIQLGTYGRKATPVLSPNYLDPSRRIKFNDTMVERVEPISITIENVADFNANIAGKLKVADVNASVDINKLGTAELVVIKFHILPGLLQDAFNANATELNRLKNIRNARIANQVFVVVSAETARKVTSATELSAKTINGTVKISGTVDTSNDTSISFSEGTTLAYGLIKPIWDRDKRKIENMVTDQQSFG